MTVTHDCRAAVNAYTKALELDPQQAALWANRAAAHLALGQAQECAQVRTSDSVSVDHGCKSSGVQSTAAQRQCLWGK